MVPFRNSLTARMVSLSLSVALIGGGLVAALGIDPTYALPTLILAAITLSIAGLVLGVYDYMGEVILVGLLLPMVLWPFFMLLEWVTRNAASAGWAFAAVGLVPLVLSVVVAPILAAKPAQSAPAGAPRSA